MTVRTVQDAMALMFKRGKANMSTEELDGLASLSDYAADEARRLSVVCEGLGCLIDYDSRNPTGAGNFRDGEDHRLLLIGRQRGIEPRPGESWAQFRGRVFAQQGRAPDRADFQKMDMTAVDFQSCAMTGQGWALLPVRGKALPIEHRATAFSG